MVKDDYQSVYAADLLKRVGTNANADESRWLIALKFNNPDEVQRWATDWQSNTDEVKALIAQAQANQTWPEEVQPLADIQTNWATYFGIDAQIRSAANNSGDPQRLHTAETISTGISNAAFGKFTDAVDQLKKANYDHYNATLTRHRKHFEPLYSLECDPLPAYWPCSRLGSLATLQRSIGGCSHRRELNQAVCVT